ncbi:MAG: cation diffusion facilitator family transporter [Oscillospiraceae bacterium]|nr:cation diffusion facilitator family transporter [Oscillospiraceae bacterium]
MGALLLKAFEKGRTDRPRESYGIFAGTVGLFCNLLLFGLKILVGILSSSVSIIADAVNNLSDAGSSAVTLLGFRLAKKPADKEHPFGHARVEYMSSALIAIVILLIGGELLKTSIEKILSPQSVVITPATMAVLAAAIGVKFFMRGFYLRVADRINSTPLRAAAQDSSNDVFTTVGVLAGAAVQYLTNLRIDGWIGAGVAVFILVSGVCILRDALSPLLGEAPPDALVDGIYRAILGYDGVLGLHDLVVHSYGPDRIFATVHVEMSASLDPLYCHGVLDNIERDMEKAFGVKLVIHLDPVAPHDEEYEKIRSAVMIAVKTIDPSLSIHDFRTVRTHDHTNVIFDVAAPAGCTSDTEDIRARVCAAVASLDESYYPVVDIDRNYNCLGFDEDD